MKRQSPLNSFVSWGAEASFLELTELLNSIKQPRPFHYSWSKNQACRFIESVLIGLPIPGFYLAKENNSTYIIDGYHRLKTIEDFRVGRFSNDGSEFRLSQVDFNSWTNCTFNDLTDLEKKRIETTTVHLLIVELKPKSLMSINDLYLRFNPTSL